MENNPNTENKEEIKQGVILKGIGGFYYVLCGEDIFECKARGLFRKEHETPLPGDQVEITVLVDEDMKGWIEKILPRKNSLVRPAVANIDNLFIVLPCKEPAPDLYLIDRILVEAEYNHINPVLIFSKCDLDDGTLLNELSVQYSGVGCEIITVSIFDDEMMAHSVSQINEIMCGKISVFTGQSGVGKSSFLNVLLGRKSMDTGAVSDKLKRGKHTTRHAELFCVNNSFIVDTPGFSSFTTSEIVYDELWNYYPEMTRLLKNESCRFNTCLHINEPGCAVKKAVAEGRLSNERYKRYTELVMRAKEQYDRRWK